MNIAHYKGYGFFDSLLFADVLPRPFSRVQVAPETINAELSPASGKIRRSHLSNCRLAHNFIIAVASRAPALMPAPGAQAF